MAEQLGLQFIAMTPDEGVVWHVLQDYIGKGQAVNQHALALITRLPARRVRDIVADLIIKHRKRICSSYDAGHGGYYLPADESEVEETCRKLHGHAVSILTRLSVLRKVTMTQLLNEYQRKLPF